MPTNIDGMFWQGFLFFPFSFSFFHVYICYVIILYYVGYIHHVIFVHPKAHMLIVVVH